MEVIPRYEFVAGLGEPSAGLRQICRGWMPELVLRARLKKFEKKCLKKKADIHYKKNGKAFKTYN